MDLIPTHDKVLVELLPSDAIKRSTGLVFLPNRNPDDCRYARVVAIGPGRETEFGFTMRPPFVPGQLVLMSPSGGRPHTHEGRAVIFVQPTDIYAVVTEDVPT